MRTFTKHILFLALLLLVAVPTYALSPETTGAAQNAKYFWGDGTEADIFLWFIVIALLFMTILLGLLFIAIVTMYRVVNGTIDQPILDTDKLWAWFTSLKPLSEEHKLELDEDYDGIKELDNPVPAWFNALFYGTVIFGLGYWLVYHTWQSAPLQTQEYTIAMEEAEVAKAQYLKLVANNIDENSVKEEKVTDIIAHGQTVYKQNCAACHGQQGEGKVGPNLTDEFWLHGGSIKEVFSTIKYGVPDKGMISWQKQLSPKDISDLSNYILSLKGTNPPNAKEPQGEKLAQK
jgi:cytochrome c oxidase cbb3-type subunit 3